MAELQPVTNAERAAESLSGTTVGRFVIGDRLGKGGMGEVYLAQDTKLKRQVALKRLAPTLRADALYRRRFQEEAERASRFSDSHVAALYDVLEEQGEMFLVMEYIEGENLRQRLRRPLTLEQFFEIAMQCAEALAAAHERGIVHCDIKPENIMLTNSGQVKILDFGVAKHLPNLTRVRPWTAPVLWVELLRICRRKCCWRRFPMAARMCFPWVWCSMKR